MKFISKTGLIISLLILISACASTKINYDPTVDFSQYKTYAFYRKGLEKLRLPAQKKRFIVHTISNILLDKGFSRSSHPDFIVNIFTDLHDRVDVYPHHYSPFYSRAYIEKSKEGTLFVDVVDLKTKKVVWSGSEYLNLQGNDYKQFRQALYKLLKNFPPEKKK